MKKLLQKALCGALALAFAVPAYADVPDALYIIGDGVGWSLTNPTPATTSDNGVFTFENVSLTNGTSYFAFINTKLDSDNDWSTINNGEHRYGPSTKNSGDAFSLTGDNSFSLVGDVSWTISGGTYTFVVDFNTMIAKIIREPLEAPENLYLLGNLEGYNWNNTNSPQFTKTSDGVFTIKDITFTGTGGTAYFSFAGELSTTSTDWTPVDNSKYIPNGEVDRNITPGESTSFKKYTKDAQPDSWTVASGTYDVTVDFNTVTMTLTGSVDWSQVSFYVLSSDLNGSANWDENQEQGKMTYEESSKTFTWSGTSLGYFKIADSTNWEGSYNLGSNGQLIEIGQPYYYENQASENISFGEDAYVTNPSVTLDPVNGTITVTGQLVETPYDPGESITLKGSFDGWGNGITMPKNQDGLYVLTTNIPAPTGSDTFIELKIDAGNDHWYGPVDGQYDINLVSGTPTVLELNGNTNANWYLQNWNGGEITFTCNFETKTLSLLWTDPTITPQPEEVDYTVYVYNNTGWENLYLYTWYTPEDADTVEDAGGWPGTKLTETEVIGSNTFYKLTLSSLEDVTENLIFTNNEGQQVEGFTYTADGNNIYVEVTINEITEIDNPDTFVPTPPVTNKYKVYAYNNTGWEDLFLYLYNGNNILAGAWPGTKLTTVEEVDGNNFYTFEIELVEGMEANLIFNNGILNDEDGKAQAEDYEYTFGEDLSLYLEVLATYATEIEDPSAFEPVEPKKETYTVYAYNNTGWDDLYLYIYGSGELAGSWPGTKLTKVADVNGYDFYEFVIEDLIVGTPENLIFNNADGIQTADYTYTFDEDLTIYLEVFENEAKAVDPTTFVPTEPQKETYTVYAYNNAGWDDLYLYIYGSSELAGPWPGTKLTEVTDVNGYDFYEFVIENLIVGTEENLIFNNGILNDEDGKAQTEDFTYTFDEDLTLYLEVFNTVAVEVEDPESFEPKDTSILTFYVIGENVDGKEWALMTNPMVYDEDEDIWVWEGEVLGSGFKINNGGWSNAEYNIGGSEANNTLVLGTPFEYTASGDSKNILFEEEVLSVKDPMVVLDLVAQTITVTGTPVYDENTGVNGFGVDAEEVVIYNLQGVRVDANKLTKGIYIINGKKVLVK